MQTAVIYAIATGSIFLLLLALLATPRKVNVYANYWLALFLFTFGCILLDRVFSDTHLYDKYPLLMGVLEITRFAASPGIYFSVLYFTTPERKRRSTDYLHFIPFTLFFIFLLTVFTGINNSWLFDWYRNLPESVRRGVAITVFTSIKVQMILYWILSYTQLMRHNRNIKLFASTLEPVSLSWLRYFLLGMAAALLLSLNETLVIVPAIVPLTDLGYLFLVYYMGYFSLRQQEIYPYKTKDVVEIRDLIEEESKPSRNHRFTESELSPLKFKLTELMEREKIFLDPNLGLPQLAGKMQMSTHDLSFLINEGFSENFYQLINRYRIDHAKGLLKSSSHAHLNILGIAYESGFRSKSTFNITFKKLTGVSPSEFMRSRDNTEKAA